MNGFYNTRAIFRNIRGKTDHAASIISGKQALDSFFIHNNIQLKFTSTASKVSGVGPKNVSLNIMVFQRKTFLCISKR